MMELKFAIRVILLLLTTTVIIICLFMESAVVPPKEKIPVPHKMDAKGKMTMKGSLERTRSNILNCDVPNNRSIEEGQLPEGAISHNTVGLTMLISKPSCKALISGKDAEYNEMKTQIFTYKYPYRPKTDYQLVTRNCHNFLRDRGYILNVTSEEIGFPLAYNILMFKDVEQVERLLRAIYRPSNFYCIHVDRKAHFKVKLQIMSIVRCFPNVFLSSRQIKVKWGGYSVLEAEMTCMKDLLQRPGWKYFINLTGQEYPLKTNLEIVRILKILNGANSIDATTNKKWKKLWKHLRNPPHKIRTYKGNTHIVVCRGFVDYIMNNPIAKDFAKWVKNAVVPDETFFTSLNHSPHLKVPGSSLVHIQTNAWKPYIARFKNWGAAWGDGNFDWPCKGKRVRDICIFGVGDLRLLTSRMELFANKFYINYQPRTFECIEEWLRERAMNEEKQNNTIGYEYYRNMEYLKYIYRNGTLV